MRNEWPRFWQVKITHYATTLVMRRGDLHTVQFPRERERLNDPSSPLLTCQGPNDFTAPQRKYLLFLVFLSPSIPLRPV